jgi:hypothetical protein
MLALAIYVWESWAVSVKPHYALDWDLAVRFAAINNISLVSFNNSALIDEADREIMKAFEQLTDTNSYVRSMMSKTVTANIRNGNYTEGLFNILRFTVNEVRRSYIVDNDVKDVLNRFMKAANETIKVEPVNSALVIIVVPGQTYSIRQASGYRR